MTILQEYHSPVLKRVLSRLEEMPAIRWEVFSEADRVVVSLAFVSRALPYITKFVYDLLSRWTVPGRRISIPHFCSSELPHPEIGGVLLVAIETKLVIDCRTEDEIIRTALPMLEAELSMGATSFFHASRIMEVKGLTLDEKAALVQEKMMDWVDRFPDFFDVDLIHWMQEFFLLTRDTFKAVRDVRQLSIMVVTFYHFAKKLKRAVEKEGRQRHIFIKTLVSTLQTPLSQKRVLGVCVGMNFLRPNEVFEETHLFKAIKNCLPHVKCVSGATYSVRASEEHAQTIYIEVEKESGQRFLPKEIRELKGGLVDSVKCHVEHLVSPIFMPRNEEEVMRNIVTLSQQLRFVRDLPQVTLSFDHQSDAHLHFTLVMVSLKLGLDKALTRSNEPLQFLPERVKRMGLLRNKHPKEAVVLKVRLAKEPFLREDLSLDLYLARQHVIEALQRVVGEVRDYNGGMIAKQVENFKALQTILGPLAEKQRYLLDNFFHSLFPIEVRSFLSPLSMKTLFSHLISLHLEKKAVKNSLKLSKENGAVFALVALSDSELKERLIARVNQLGLRWPQLVFLHQHVFETTYVGYILFTEDECVRKSFFEILHTSLTFAPNS